MSEFVPFPKIARLSREVIVTEKIDGTNGLIEIGEDGESMQVGSRSRWITPEQDNYGFARWAAFNHDELLKLGPGRHFGEWWGLGIQRSYGLKEKRFSLFNVSRWADDAARPACCHVVPELWRGEFDTLQIGFVLSRLRSVGSLAAPGFMNPEGVVIYHAQGNVLFKKTIVGDEKGKEHGA